MLAYVKEFKTDVLEALKKKYTKTNVQSLPRLDKVIVSVGIGTFMQSSRDYSQIEKNLELLTGQKPALRKAKKAISNFKLREGMPVALMVTLRGPRMYAFISKLIKVVLPRVRDFRGLPKKSFDGSGNYTIGLKEQTVFPEVRQEDGITLHGVQITFSTTAKTDEQGRALMETIGLPIQS